MNFNKVGILKIDGDRMGFRPIDIEYKYNNFAQIRGELFELLSMSERIKIDYPIKNVIFNDPATIVIWSDGTKTVVKCQEGDTYDPEKGLAMCLAKKYLGNKGNFNEVFKKWVPENKPKSIAIEPISGLAYGTKVFILETTNGCRGAELREGFITDESLTSGLFAEEPGYNVHTTNGQIWRINPDAKIEILKED